MLATSAREILDSFTAEIAVLDGSGTIIAVNEAWKRFGAKNGGAVDGIGADYPAVCERAVASDPTGTAQATLDGLRALMRGETESFTLEYPCHSPEEERWYCLRATRFAGAETAFVVAHEDISARRRSENALRETERTLREVLETLPVGVWIMDRSGRITHGNPAGLRIWSGARYVGPEQFGEYKGWWLSTGEPIAAEVWAAARAMRGEVSIDEEIEIECFDGTRKIIVNSAMPLRDESGAIAGAIIVNQDITARKRIEKELEQTLGRERILARTDELTGAFNRRHFFELAVHEIAVAKRYRQPVSVILFDLDHFKRINDTGGHEAGDEALRRVARIVRDHLRESDLFARYGGEEFVLLLPRTTADQAAIVAERIRMEIAENTALTISGGVAGLSFGDDSLDRLIRRADNALYRAKQEGRNRTVLA
jgi:diguanylate cyclase (GGDEF)-like protein